jgi:hypothetical protein
MCPDNCDLWCTLIVTQVVKSDGYIKWKKVGIESSTREDMLLGYDRIGSRVEWLDQIPPMTFAESQYRSQLNKTI